MHNCIALMQYYSETLGLCFATLHLRKCSHLSNFRSRDNTEKTKRKLWYQENTMKCTLVDFVLDSL